MSESHGRNEGFYVFEEFACDALPLWSVASKTNGQHSRRPPRKLFTVAGLSTVESRGTVLAPGLTPEPGEDFQIGDPVRLRRPDGSEIQVAIRGLDFFHPGHDGAWLVLVALPESEIPIGTDVWST